MTLLLYGITDAEAVAGETTGIDGARLETVRHRQLVAIVSAEHEPDQPADLDRMLRYERVVQTLMERQALLPARFASRSPGAVQLCQRLEQEHDALLSALERVRGAVELALRAEWLDPAPARSGGVQQNGTGYMLERLDLHRRATVVARRLDPLASRARECRMRVMPRPEVAVSGAYLVDSGQLEPFTETLRDIDGATEQVDFVCTGPWPPYSFVGDVRG
jgi:Gas vesicle synthesis protein GvpL/GvpF